MLSWIDERTWVLVEFDRDVCHLSDGRRPRRRFHVAGAAELEPFTPGLEATPPMVEAWSRFCERKAAGS